MNFLEGNYYICLLAFFISALNAIFIMPSVLKIGHKFNVLDEPNHRKLHTKATVRLGGLSIFFGTAIGIFTFYISGYFNNFSIENKEKLAVTLFFSFLLFCLGFFDDLFSLTPFSRLILQIILSIMFFYKLDLNYTIQISWGLNYIEPIAIPSYISNLFAIFWLVGITNAFNWLDGIDGLASGISLLISIPLCIISLSGSIPSLCVLPLALGGSCAGFLKDNLITKKILMGDGGSYLLGFSIAAISLISIPELFSPKNLIIPIFIIFVPLIDMARVIILRLFNRISPFYPDRKHIHYLLIDHGMELKSTLYVLYMVTISTSLFGLGLLHNENFRILSSIALLILILGSIPLFLKQITPPKNIN